MPRLAGLWQEAGSCGSQSCTREDAFLEVGFHVKAPGHPDYHCRCTVATPEALRARASDTIISWGGTLLVSDYVDWAVRDAIADIVQRARGESWLEVGKKLQRFFVVERGSDSAGIGPDRG